MSILPARGMYTVPHNMHVSCSAMGPNDCDTCQLSLSLSLSLSLWVGVCFINDRK